MHTRTRLLIISHHFEGIIKQSQGLVPPDPIKLGPAWNLMTQDYFTGSEKAGDQPHTYQDYTTPALTPLDYGDQPKKESPYGEHAYEEFSYIDRSNYDRNLDKTYQGQVSPTQSISYRPGQKPATTTTPQQETLPQFLVRTYTGLRQGKPLTSTDMNFWGKYQPLLTTRLTQLNKLPTPTPQQIQEKNILVFMMSKLQGKTYSELLQAGKVSDPRKATQVPFKA